MKKNLLQLTLVTLLFLSACAKEDPQPAPHRGNWMSNVTVGKNLVEKLKKDRKFDAAGSCVQMVNRDKVEDGVKRAQNYLVFFTNACPVEKRVADSEAFSVEMEADRGTYRGPNPSAAAFHLIKNQVPVGYVTRKGDSEFELGDLCLVENFYRQNCEIEIDPKGKFVQLSTARAAIGKWERERVTDNLIRHVEKRVNEMENSLSGQLLTAQTNLIDTFKGNLAAVQQRVVNHQYISAYVTMGYVERSQTQMETTLSRNHSAAIVAFREDVRSQLANVQKNLTEEIQRQMKALHARLDTVDKKLKVIHDRIDEVETSLINHQWWTAWAVVNDLSWRLYYLEQELRAHGDEKATDVICQVSAQIHDYSNQIKDALKREIETAEGRFSLALNLAEGRFEAKLGTEASSLKTAISDVKRLAEGSNTKVDNLKTQITDYDKTFREELKKTNEEVKKANDEAKKANDEAKKANDEAKKANDEAKKANDEAKKANDEAKKANDEAKKANDEAKKANDEAKKANDEAKKANDEAKKAKDDAKKADEKAAEAKADAKKADDKAVEAKADAKKADDAAKAADAEAKKARTEAAGALEAAKKASESAQQNSETILKELGNLRFLTQEYGNYLVRDLRISAQRQADFGKTTVKNVRTRLDGTLDAAKLKALADIETDLGKLSDLIKAEKWAEAKPAIEGLIPRLADAELYEGLTNDEKNQISRLRETLGDYKRQLAKEVLQKAIPQTRSAITILEAYAGNEGKDLPAAGRDRLDATVVQLKILEKRFTDGNWDIAHLRTLPLVALGVTSAVSQGVGAMNEDQITSLRRYQLTLLQFNELWASSLRENAVLAAGETTVALTAVELPNPADTKEIANYLAQLATVRAALTTLETNPGKLESLARAATALDLLSAKLPKDLDQKTRLTVGNFHRLLNRTTAANSATTRFTEVAVTLLLELNQPFGMPDNAKRSAAIASTSILLDKSIQKALAGNAEEFATSAKDLVKEFTKATFTDGIVKEWGTDNVRLPRVTRACGNLDKIVKSFP